MNSFAQRLLPWCLGIAFTCSCVPAIDDDPSLAVEGQILAVQFEPAEAEPESSTQVNALVVSDTQDRSNDVAFALCVARKPLSELGPVHPACLTGANDGSEALTPLGNGRSVLFEVPNNACSLFGPLRPPPEPGQPPGRPVDPDATGGFYQPVVATLDSAVLGSLRLDCGLPGGSQVQVAQYNQQHIPNQNPIATKLQIRVAHGDWQTLPLDDGALRVPRNKTVSVRSEWDEPERYLFLSAESRDLTHKNESLLASFYSSVGGFDEHRVTVDNAGRVESELHTPDEKGEVQVWVVVRDGRSGTGWVTFKLDVR